MIAMVIVAGGSGTRMGAQLPKQYMCIGKHPILMHTLRHALMILSPEDRIIVVVPRGDEAMVARMIEEHIDSSLSPERVLLTEGGDTRTESVRNGLALVGDADIVAIHDSVRIFFGRSLLHDLALIAKSGDVAVPVQECTDSVIMAPEQKEAYYIPRSEVMLVKTPQLFPASALLSSYRAYNPEVHGVFTDDASLVRCLSPETKLRVVKIPYFNNKITYPTDIEQAERVLQSFDPLM